MRHICFGRRGVKLIKKFLQKKAINLFSFKNKSNIRKHLREFKGYDFERNSDEYEKYLRNLIK